MKSFCELEDMSGTSIIAPLAKVYKDVLLSAGVTLNNSQIVEVERCATIKDFMEIVLKIWLPQKGTLFPTWASLLLVLGSVGEYNLRHQIKDLLGELSGKHSFWGMGLLITK